MPHASSSSTSSTSSHASAQGVPSASSVQSQYAYLKTDPDFNDKRVDWSQKEQLLLEGCNYDGETPLILAAAAGDLDALKALLQCGANHRHCDQHGHTALVAAARNGALSIVKALTEPELPDGTVRQLQLALAWAAWEGHYDVVKYLMDKVSVDDVMTPDRDTPLTLAACTGRKDVIKLLLENGASLHNANASGHGALALAAVAGHKACVDVLLDISVDPRFKAFSSEELGVAWAAAKKYCNVQLDIQDFAEHSGYTLDQPIMRIAYARPTDAALRTIGTLAQLLPAASKDDIVEQLVYDARGLLVADIDGESYLTSYRYDGNGNRTDAIRYAQALTSAQRAALVAGGIGATLPPIASLADQHQQFFYDLLNRLVTRTDGSGTVTRNDYDSMGWLTASTTAAGTPDARTQTSRYDLQGRLVAELSGEGSAALAAPGASVAAVWQAYATSYTYDAAGRLTSHTDANGHRTLFFYNADSQMVYAINSLGEVEAHRYDGLSQETGITHYATRLDAATLATLQGGLASAQSDVLIAALANAGTDVNATVAYDRAGRQIDRTDALGIHTRQRYDSFGDAIATTIFTETGPIQTRRHFDARGLLLNETRDAFGLAATTRQEYDAFGRVVRSTDARGNVHAAQYDRLSRTVQVVDATGATQSTAYDAFSRVIIRTDAIGNATTLRYDDQARSTTLTTAEGVTITTVMNRHGQTQSVTDGNGNVTQLTYDRDGNPVAQDTALAHTESHYDHTGLLIETVDGNGTITRLRYDAASRSSSPAMRSC